MEKFDVGVVGAGYVGLVTGACLAYIGHRVVCVDKDEERVAGLEKGRMPIYEPGLAELVANSDGRLRFTTDLDVAVRGSDAVLIAVDTPQGEDGAADLSSVAAVARGLGRVLAGGAPGESRSRERPLIVVNKSTVPAGSGDFVSMLVRDGMEESGGWAAGRERPFRVVSNPEFLREGSAVYDSLFPDRIVVGAGTQDAAEVMRALYGPIIEQSFSTTLDPRPKVAVPLVIMDLASAEMVKYAANAFLATKISFINEISNVCELVGADVAEVARGIGLDGRIGPRFLGAGLGWGGSCFPKDVAALRSMAREYEHETPLLGAVVAVNERQRKIVIQKLQRELRTLKGKRVALLGLAFKPNTDDLREAPSLEIAASLSSLGAKVVGYDPVAGKAAAQLAASGEAPGLEELEVVFDPYEAVAGAHAAVVTTEWEEVRRLDLRRVGSMMAGQPVLVDGRNLFDPREVRAAAIRYRGFGRG